MNEPQITTETKQVEVNVPLQKILSHLPSHANNRALRDKMAHAICGDSKIPRSAFTDQKLMEMMTESEVNLEDLAECIKTDPTLNFKIIQLSRTALYSRGEEANSFEDAFYRLGLKEIRNIVYADKMSSGFSEFTVEVDWLDFWKRSVLKARLAEIFMTACIGDKNFGFVAGLLNDTGSLIMLEYLPEEYRAVLELIASGVSKEEAENNIIGFTHAHVAGVLCLRWRLPYNLAMGIYHHHSDLSRLDDVVEVEMYARASMVAERVCDYCLQIVHEGTGYEALEAYYQSAAWNQFMALTVNKDFVERMDLQKEAESASELARILVSP